MKKTHSSLLSIVVFTLILGSSGASAGETFELNRVGAADLLEIAADSANGGVGSVKADVPACEIVPGKGAGGSFRRYQFEVKTLLYSESRLVTQPAVLKVAFDLESRINSDRERSIRNLEYTLELMREGAIPMPGYTMASAGSGSRPDFYPADPRWGRNQLAYAEESRGEVEFFIEAGSNIDQRAAGTVLDTAIKRLNGGRSHGAKAVLKIYPYCSPDLTSCSLGAHSGLTYNHWGSGWTNSGAPDFRMISEQTFSLVPALR